ncbi:MAG: hypothetical protein AAF810_17910, partial [Cyanobacteria bacterium P01_D01_bin.36]
MQLLKQFSFRNFSLGLLALGLFFVEVPAQASEQLASGSNSEGADEKASPGMAGGIAESVDLLDELVSQQSVDDVADSALIEAPVLASSLTLQSLSNAASAAED